MSIEQLEVHWSCAGRRYSFSIDEEGTPHLDGVSFSSRVATDLTPSDRAPRHARRGKAWEEEEEQAIRDALARGDGFATMATTTGRSEGAVRARLVRMGLLTEEEAGLRYPVKVEIPGAEVGR